VNRLVGSVRKILVSLAVEAELAPWRRLRPFRRAPFDKSSARAAEIGNAQVLVVLTGVGARRIQSLSALLAQYRPCLGIVAGVAAGLKRELRAGDVLVAESIWNPNQNEKIESDRDLIDCAVDCGAKPVRRFVAVGEILRSAVAKSGMAGLGDAADMESLVVMQRLSHEGIPAVAVRVIADSAEEDVPCDFEASLDHWGQIRLGRVLLQTIRRPRTLPRVAEFGLTSRMATQVLARYLDGFVVRLAEQDTAQLSAV
jgi:adenosylhomocysteine nucleosidase